MIRFSISRKHVSYVLFGVVLISSCTSYKPDDGIPTESNQSSPTPTLVLASTVTPTQPPVSTPDLRVLELSSDHFKLTLEDLPKDGRYRLPYFPSCFDPTNEECALASDLIEGPHLNREVLWDMGTEKGSQYINDTGRVEGWYVFYFRRAGFDKYPEIIYNNVIRFDQIDGAKMYMDTYADDDAGSYVQVDGYDDIGDYSKAYVKYDKEKYFILTFSYKNYVQRIAFVGSEKEIKDNLIFALAEKLLQRMENEFTSGEQIQTIETPLNPATPLNDATTISTLSADDLGIIIEEPRSFLLSLDHLPVKGRYYLPNEDWISPHHNIEILQEQGTEQGQEYITETARVDGWWVSYRRQENNDLLPVEFYDNVIMYETSAGARLYIEKYADGAIDNGYVEIESPQRMGDASREFTLRKYGKFHYMIEFAYRNYVHRLIGYGLEAEVDPELMHEIALQLLEDLQNATVSNP